LKVSEYGDCHLAIGGEEVQIYKEQFYYLEIMED
jgi:hypothetical protein